MPASEPVPPGWLAGGGAMGTLIRQMEWAQTPLGPIETWPSSLRTTVSLSLASNFPINIIWGPARTQIYNDGYWPICGAKHPRSMGQDFKACWFSAWDAVGAAFERAVAGETSFIVNERMFLDRYGYLEETFFTFSLSPIRDESGTVVGVFHPVTEMTTQTLAERRLKVVRELADRTVEEKSVDDACAAIGAALAEQQLDVPFALIYLFEADGARARLAAASGIRRGGALSPESVDLHIADPAVWPLAEVAAQGLPQEMTNLAARFGTIACGPYEEPSHTALVQPILLPGVAQPFGALVAGVSARRELDAPYRTFCQMLGEGVTNALANARAYEQERQRAAMLAELDRAKTLFFSNVSHEFRTPLTLLLGPLQDVLQDEDGNLPLAAREELVVAQRNGERLLKLVNTLLDFARIEAGRSDASFLPTDLAAATTELASVFRSAMERAGLRFVVDCPPLPEPIYVDREMWEKVVLNLLSNAFKFTLAGEIAVSLRAVENRVVLTVRDTGSGIPPADLPHLFERFYRVRTAQARSHEGTGIGLALVQELVKLHGGAITVESAVGAGTTVQVTLPLGAAHLSAERVGAARTLASTASAASAYVAEAERWLPDAEVADTVAIAPATLADAGTPLRLGVGRAARILVADDNTDMREYLTRLLSGYWTVEAVANGAAALAAAQTYLPDLIVSDVMMPVLDGVALVQALRAEPRTRQVPVILLSARAGEDARIEGLNAGADDYLVKPFAARELLARVGAQVELGQLRAAALQQEQTLRREVEQERLRLYTLFMEAPAIICLLQGPEHRYVFANPLYCQIVGGREIIGRSIREALPELTGQGFYELLDRVYATGEPYLGTEQLVRLDRSGSGAVEDVYLNFVYQPTHDAEGRTDGVLVHAVEVTDQVLARRQAERLAAENARLYREAQEALKQRDAFVGAITHDLKSPLTTVRGMSELLQRRIGRLETDGADRLRENLAAIQAESERAAGMVNELVDLSRLQSGQALELNLGPVDLVALVRARIAAAQATVSTLTFVLDPAVAELEGLWDRERLGRVVANLIGNAIKYSPEGGGVTVRVAREGRWAVLTVADRGLGIPAADLPHIFERFYRGSNVAGRLPGSGIGLAGSRQIVEQHGGAISATSSEGVGAVLTVRLPLDLAE